MPEAVADRRQARQAAAVAAHLQADNVAVPRVDSAVVRMVPLQHPVPVDPKLLLELVQVAFSQRRKLLRHTLGKWLEQQGYGGSFDLQAAASGPSEVAVVPSPSTAAPLPIANTTP